MKGKNSSWLGVFSVQHSEGLELPYLTEEAKEELCGHISASVKEFLSNKWTNINSEVNSSVCVKAPQTLSDPHPPPWTTTDFVTIH